MSTLWSIIGLAIVGAIVYSLLSRQNVEDADDEGMVRLTNEEYGEELSRHIIKDNDEEYAKETTSQMRHDKEEDTTSSPLGSVDAAMGRARRDRGRIAEKDKEYGEELDYGNADEEYGIELNPGRTDDEYERIFQFDVDEEYGKEYDPARWGEGGRTLKNNPKPKKDLDHERDIREHAILMGHEKEETADEISEYGTGDFRYQLTTADEESSNASDPELGEYSLNFTQADAEFGGDLDLIDDIRKHANLMGYEEEEFGNKFRGDLKNHHRSIGSRRIKLEDDDDDDDLPMASKTRMTGFADHPFMMDDDVSRRKEERRNRMKKRNH